MHIPDGFIDGKTVATTAALAVVGVGLALRRVRRELPPRRVPLLGLAAAFLFAAQMLNFPVAAGTSGHLIGGALVAALLGPSAAVVVVTTVLIVQCFLFADGGVSALGANIFNMALLGSVGGYGVYRLLCRLLPGQRGRVTALAFAGWFSTVLAAIGCAGQLAWSGTVGWAAAFSSMTSVHLIIGVGEGLISALVLVGVERARPDLVHQPGRNGLTQAAGAFVGYGLLIAIGLAVFVAPFASSWPDGLEFIAEKMGFSAKATAPQLPAPVPDYAMPGVSWVVGATALAGLVGALVVFGLAWLLGGLLVPKAGGDNTLPVTKT
jgi:cobalt/nickel transport system permease protein